MENIKIIDNFLPDCQFYDMQQHLMSNKWDWNCNPYTVSKDLEEPNVSQFVNVIYSENMWWNNNGNFLKPLLSSINPLIWVRIKANLIPKTPEIEKTALHTDYPVHDDLYTGILTALFYINTNNGFTYFENGYTVESVANRLVIFPNHLIHGGTSCTDQKTRVLVNLNYIPLRNSVRL